MSIKSTIAAVAASPFLLAGAAFAGPYVNIEATFHILMETIQVLLLTLLLVTKVQHLKEKLHITFKVVLHSFMTKLLMILRLSSLVKLVHLLALAKI